MSSLPALLNQTTEVVDGHTYQVAIRQETPVSRPLQKPDPQKVYLDVWVTDDVNGITEDHQTFELTGHIKPVDN
tara:strand:- start:179 stop:400 length:222 start_codon:yes stop_codon:yes gene_type:complete